MNTPTLVDDTNAWDAVAAGDEHICGVADGELYCWGSSRDGQLGLGEQVREAYTPTRVGEDADWETITAGSEYTCGLRNAGALYCWGRNIGGSLGFGGQNTRGIHDPTLLGGAQWTDIAGHGGHLCGVQTDGGLWCWGSNTFGQLGIGSTLLETQPTRVGEDSDWSDVEVGFAYTCALKNDDSSWCWGQGDLAQLGHGAHFQWEPSNVWP